MKNGIEMLLALEMYEHLGVKFKTVVDCPRTTAAKIQFDLRESQFDLRKSHLFMSNHFQSFA